MLTWILAVLGLFFLQTFLPTILKYAEQGDPVASLKHALGARDEVLPMTVIGERSVRALGNMKEALPVFIALALLLEINGMNSGIGLTGAMVFTLARGLYIPAYLLGITGFRTAVWSVSVAGLVMMVMALVNG